MLRQKSSILALVVAAVAAGCGGEVTDVTDGVDELNKVVLQPQGAELACPDEVDGGKGTTFECTMRGKGEKTEKVKLKIIEEEGALRIDIADENAFRRALANVSKT